MLSIAWFLHGMAEGIERVGLECRRTSGRAKAYGAPYTFRMSVWCVTIFVGQNYGTSSEPIHLRAGKRAHMDPDHHSGNPGGGYLEPDCVPREQPDRAVAGGRDGSICGITHLFHPAALRLS